MGLVEIGCQEETGLVAQHWVNAHDEIAVLVIAARKVPTDCIVCDGKKAALRAIGAFDYYKPEAHSLAHAG